MLVWGIYVMNNTIREFVQWPLIARNPKAPATQIIVRDSKNPINNSPDHLVMNSGFLYLLNCGGGSSSSSGYGGRGAPFDLTGEKCCEGRVGEVGSLMGVFGGLGGGICDWLYAEVGGGGWGTMILSSLPRYGRSLDIRGGVDSPEISEYLSCAGAYWSGYGGFPGTR